MKETRKLTQDSLYNLIADLPDLSKGENRVIRWYLSYGRAFVTASFLFSFPALVIISSWARYNVNVAYLLQHPGAVIITVTWLILSIVAIVYSAPIIVWAFYNTVVGIPKKHRDRLNVAELLWAVFLGWDRYFKKKGRHQGEEIKSPYDLFEDNVNKEHLIQTAKRFFDMANGLSPEEQKYKTLLYLGVFSALEEEYAIKEQFLGQYAPRAQSEFLSKLGDQYKISDRTLRNSYSTNSRVPYNGDSIYYSQYLKIVEAEIRGK